jgi:membrane protein
MKKWQSATQVWQRFWQDVISDLRRFPWRNTAITLRERFREDRLGQTASSLTFTTVMALVPLFTVGLAIFSAFPMFARFEGVVEKWLVQSLVPDQIARTVLKYLHQFSSKAGELGWLGAVVLLITALALILTIDRKLNDIWRVRKLRPLSHRVLTYWAVLTLGPLMLAVSASLTTYLFSASKGLIAGPGASWLWVLDVLEYFMVVAGLAALYHYVPNARVRWSHAFISGLLVSAAIEVVKKGLGWYLGEVPTYSAVYGAFATVPILLIWIYLAWAVVLLGAVVAAYLPSLLRGVARRSDQPGWDYQLSLEILQQLQLAHKGHAQDAASITELPRGLSAEELAVALRVDALHLEVPMDALLELDWVGKLDETHSRYVLLANLELMPLAPLVQALLLPKSRHSLAMWHASGWADKTVQEALPNGDVLHQA